MRISDWSSDVCSSDLELGQESVEARGESERERFERGGPGGVVARGLGVEREEPGPAIGALERRGVRAIEESEFARDLVGDEHFVGARADFGGDGKIGEAAREAEDLPPAGDAADRKSKRLNSSH